MLLAELNIRHTRRHMPTRRWRSTTVPAHQRAPFGGVLIGAVIAEHVPGLDEDQLDALDRFVDVARRGLTVPRIALRYRLQTDTHGLDLSRHRITSADVERGSVRPILGARPAQPVGTAGDRRDHGRRAAPAVGTQCRLPLRRRRRRPPRRAPRGLEVRRMYEGLPGVRPPPPGTTTKIGTAQSVGRENGPGSRRNGAGPWRSSGSTPASASSVTTCSGGSAAWYGWRTPITAGQQRRGGAHRRAHRGARAAPRRDRFGRNGACRVGFAHVREPPHVTVTGAAGQIGYALVHRIASGQLLGPRPTGRAAAARYRTRAPVARGVVMELEDGAHPLLVGIEATADLKTAFDGTSWALLVGSIPRKAGMERGDLLSVNGGSSSPRARPSTTTRRATCACSWSETRATPTA